MGIFSRLFGSHETRRVRAIIRKVGREHRPVADLAMEIGGTAMKCGAAMKPHVHFESEDKSTEMWIYVCFEFIYLFMHLTDRVAFSKLGPERRSVLMEELRPLVIDPVVETFFEHWPDELKARMLAEFYEKLNDAQLGYFTCKELVSKDNPITGDALFSTFARNVVELCGDSPLDLAAFIVPYTIAIGAWTDMHVAKHVEAFG